MSCSGILAIPRNSNDVFPGVLPTLGDNNDVLRDVFLTSVATMALSTCFVVSFQLQETTMIRFPVSFHFQDVLSLRSFSVNVRLPQRTMRMRTT